MINNSKKNYRFGKKILKNNNHNLLKEIEDLALLTYILTLYPTDYTDLRVSAD